MLSDAFPLFATGPVTGTTSSDRSQAEVFTAWNPAWKVEEARDDEGATYLSVVPPGQQCAWWICRTTEYWVTALSPCGAKVIRFTDVAAALAGVWEHAT
ncbi:hypothetical protein [Roseomonas sp. BN140053]|uniref:hypothetical protein n=1 Tax=Roseomonas sp. BN140053 TaxID=3391898 RepID=UPI0039EA8B8D